MELKNGTYLNICQGNSNRVAIGLQHYVYRERTCRIENKSSLTRPHKWFWTLSSLESEDWSAPAPIWQQYSIFSLNRLLHDRRTWVLPIAIYWANCFSSIFINRLYIRVPLVAQSLLWWYRRSAQIAWLILTICWFIMHQWTQWDKVNVNHIICVKISTYIFL